MSRTRAAIIEWLRPRKRHAFVGLWLRSILCLLPIWAADRLFSHGPWHEDLGPILMLSLCFALGNYGYFHVHGGTDEDYPHLRGSRNASRFL